MKQAKVEATQVVEKYLKDKQDEFRKKASSTNVSAEAKALEQQTSADIAQMKTTFSSNKQANFGFHSFFVCA